MESGIKVTPKEYIEYKLRDELKGNVRIWVTNMLNMSYLQSDKDFYSQALVELDKTN